MASTFSGLEIGRLGLFAQQTALNTTGHNIANANTEGYTRQRVNMEATKAFPYPSTVNDRSAGQVGTGVLVSSIERLRESFLDLQFRGENKNVGEYGARVDTLEKIEVILNEPTDSGLQKTMDEFWNAWQKVSANPGDTAAREVVRENATTMTESFAFIHREMVQQQNNVNEDIKTKAIELQGYLDTIAQLNAKINDVVPHGYTPNDLYDQRDLILDKISNFMNIEVQPVAIEGKDTGMVNVFLKDNSGARTVLVSEKFASKISAQAGDAKLLDGQTDKLELLISEAGLRDGSTEPAAPEGTAGESVNVTGGGALKGLLESRDTIIPDYLKRIGNLAAELAKQVNEIHEKGRDLDGGSGTPFFVSKSGGDLTNPGDIIVNPLIMASVNKIAVGAAGGGTGDNKTALAIYALKEKNDLNFGGEKASFDSYTRSIIAKLGSETREAQRMKTNVESLTSEVENRRQSMSGVSLDEEMSNMIKFQHAYSACARTITAMDEMLDKIINGMGLVGR